MQHNEHIATLGYRLESTSDVAMVRPLLETVRLSAVEDDPLEPASEYLLATTRAGGLAACAGWTRLSDTVVLHSLAVAPPSLTPSTSWIEPSDLAKISMNET